jgi:ABC-type phosphate transport system substrate-binding protein
MALAVVLLVVAMVLGICGCAALITSPGRGDDHTAQACAGDRGHRAAATEAGHDGEVRE